jgi:hypothetical protein
MLPIRVFVGSTRAEWLPTRVLEFSIRETTVSPIAFHRIEAFERSIPTPHATKNRARTPFSFQRFLIPELCGYEGRAIYLDADMQVFADINALWGRDMVGHALLSVREGAEGRKGQFSVMLLDCDRLSWRIEEIIEGLDAGRYTYEQLVCDMCIVKSVGRTVEPDWNCLEKYEPGQTRLLHYTDMNTQPWVSIKNPLRQHWVECLKRAISTGFVTRDEVAHEVRAGHVRPSLLAEVDVVPSDMQTLSALDRKFVAPYKALGGSGPRSLREFRSLLSRIAFFVARR